LVTSARRQISLDCHPAINGVVALEVIGNRSGDDLCARGPPSHAQRRLVAGVMAYATLSCAPITTKVET
jgi:hypothetical protein